MQYGRFNFYKNTFCIFRQVDNSVIANMEPDHISRSGSRYYFTEEGVFRFSTHWGRAATCKWRLTAADGKKYDRKGSAGFAKWEDFFYDDDHSRIYWIKLSDDGTSVHYFHKDDSQYDGAILRTSGDTMRIIRKIRNVLNNQEYSDLEINGLLFS